MAIPEKERRAKPEQQQQRITKVRAEVPEPVGRWTAGGGAEGGIVWVVGDERDRAGNSYCDEHRAHRADREPAHAFAKRIPPVGRQFALGRARRNRCHSHPHDFGANSHWDFAVKRTRGIIATNGLGPATMDRADVIIFGGGLVGLALVSALNSSGCRPSWSTPPIRRRAPAASFDGRTSAVSSSSMRMLETIGVQPHLAEPGCAIRRIAVADGLQPGGINFDSDDGAARLHARKPQLRAALQARAEAGKNAWLLWKSRCDVDRGDHGVLVALEDGRKLSAPLLIAATAATRQPEKPPGSMSRAGNMIITRSSPCSGMNGRMIMSPMRFSIRPVRSRCCP